MKIVCKVIREGGSNVEFPDGKKYHFKPDPNQNNLHIADVTDQKHIDWFLSVTEAYVALDRVDEPEPQPEPEPPAAPQPVAEWNNKKTFAYAKEVLGLTVPEDKKAIAALAEAAGLKLDARKGAAPMLREYIAHVGVVDDDTEE
ncbi:MAG: hypothetical protein AB7E72_16235 [Lysobacterales bacterium]